MSWDVSLVDKNGKVLKVQRHYGEGGTFIQYSVTPLRRGSFPGTGIREEGSTDAELNVTYNYYPFYHAYLDTDGLNWLHGKRAKDVASRLSQAIRILGKKRSKDYWEATPGNAGFALSILLEWAKERPTGTFMVA